MATTHPGSMTYQAIIDGYIASIEQTFVPEVDFTLEEHVILEAGEIRRVFLEEYNFLPGRITLPSS